MTIDLNAQSSLIERMALCLHRLNTELTQDVEGRLKLVAVHIHALEDTMRVGLAAKQRQGSIEEASVESLIAVVRRLAHKYGGNVALIDYQHVPEKDVVCINFDVTDTGSLANRSMPSMLSTALH